MTSTRRLRSPFVTITLSTLSIAAVACDNEVTIFGDAGGGGASSASSSGSGPATSGSTSGSPVGATTGSSGAGGAGGGEPIDCPPEPPTSYEPCTLSGEGACSYTLDCQSGPVALSFGCSPESGLWTVLEQPCEYEYDSCPGTELYCAGQWWLPEGTNPPSPCPDPAPAELSECFSGGFGGVHQRCGYPCGDDASSGWTIATCSGEFDAEVWEYDDACAR